MYRNADTVPVSAVQWAEFGKSLGFLKEDLIMAVNKIFTPSNYQKVNAQHLDPRVQHILSCLSGRGLPIPQELPAIPVNPDSQKFTNLVYVDTTIPLLTLISAIEVGGKSLTNHLDLSKIKDVVETPKASYFVWMQDGRLYKGQSPNQAVALFSPNERGATVREGLSLILHYPEIPKDHYIDLPGSWCDRVGVPCLAGWDDDPRLSASGAGFADSYFGSASVGVSLNP